MKSFYLTLNKTLYDHPFVKSCVHFCSGFCPYITFLFYGLFLLKILIEWKTQIWSFIYKPLLTLIITLVLKVVINRKRPYELYPEIKPLLEQKRKSHSFPSIHVSFSLSVALTVIEYGPNMGLLLAALSIVIIVTRFLNGSHYLSDVIASILIAIIISSI